MLALICLSCMSLVWAHSFLFVNRTPVRLGTIPWPGYDLLHIAQQQGYFKQYGLDIELIQMSSLSDLRKAYERGFIDGYTGTMAEVLEADIYGKRKSVITLITDYSNGGDILLAQPRYRKLSELKNGKIGIEWSGLGTFMLTQALKHENLAAKDFDIQRMNQDALEEGMINNKLDAIVTYEPYATRIITHIDARNLYNSSYIPEKILSLVAFSPDVLKKHKNIMPAMFKAWDKAYTYFHEHPGEALESIAKLDMCSVEQAELLTDTLHILSSAEQRTILTDAKTHDILREYADLIISPDDQGKIRNIEEYFAPEFITTHTTSHADYVPKEPAKP